MTRRPLALMALALLMLTVQCRTTNPERDAELASVEDRPWFDLYGERIACEVPPGGCAENTYDVKYVDLCVAKGFQAKTCGCTAGCSGKVQELPKPAKAELAKADPNGCEPSILAELKKTLADKSAGQMKCVSAHVCNGDPSNCDVETRKVADGLRVIARGKCKNEVFSGVCEGGSKDTLGCSERNVDLLAVIYDKAFFSGDPKYRRCVRERFCNKNGAPTACDGLDQKVITGADAALTEDGCGYWLASLCSIDGK